MDLTITLGNVLQILTTITAILLAYGRLKERLIAIETQIAPLWSEYNTRRTVKRRAEDREE